VTAGGSGWTPALEHFVAEEEQILLDLLRDPVIYKIEDPDFWGIFWKTAQIALLARTASRAWPAMSIPRTESVAGWKRKEWACRRS